MSNFIIDKSHLSEYQELVNDITEQILSRLTKDSTTITPNIEVNVIDNLNSDSGEDALSAKMGKQIKIDMQSLVEQVYSNIVDNLNSNSKNKFLSANMGKVLSDKITNLETISANGFGDIPRGLICMWSGNIFNIPEGWALCDGSNNTPNLLDKFIKSIPNKDNSNMNHIGGSHQLVLTEDNMPQHSHNIYHRHTTEPHKHNSYHKHDLSDASTLDAGSHNHEFKDDNSYTWNNCLYKTNNIISVNHESSGTYIIAAAQKRNNISNSDYTFSTNTKTSKNHSHKLTGNTKYSNDNTADMIVEVNPYEGTSLTAGKNIPFDNRPEYYELAFIMKL